MLCLLYHAPLLSATYFFSFFDFFAKKFLALQGFGWIIHYLLCQTNAGNELILDNLCWLKNRSIPFTIRIPLIPNCNDDAENLQRTAELLLGGSSPMSVELLPLNPFSTYAAQIKNSTFPSSASHEEATDIFKNHGIPCKVL